MPVLDAVRSAALMVVGYHVVAWQSRMPSSDLVARGLVTAFRPGWFGVDLFFILCGFLITNILLATRERPRYVLDFYVRRALRIVIGVRLFRGWALLHAPRWDTFAFTPFRIDVILVGCFLLAFVTRVLAD